MRSAHKSTTGEITVKKITLIIALAIVFNIGVLAGDQTAGGKTCVPTSTQSCIVQPEEPIYVKVINFLKAIF